MAVRVPAILDEVLLRNPTYSAEIAGDVQELAAALRENRELPWLSSQAPYASSWLTELEQRRGQSWLSTDWFFAETYAYRQWVERVRFFESGEDPFAPWKRDEYASDTHAQAFDGALAASLDSARSERERAIELLGLALFGNRIDLSFAASRAHGSLVEEGDLLADAREAATEQLFEGAGAVHLIADNVGTELTLDLVLLDFVLSVVRAPVVLHLKVHPTFVSDAIREDVQSFLDTTSAAPNEARSACAQRLTQAIREGRLLLAPHAYWNGPASLSALPGDLEASLAQARLVVLKGDANYRRALNDAVWPSDTSFRAATAFFPAPLLALRTLKSDPIVDLEPGRATLLDRLDPNWRVNGKRGVASLGGSLRHS